MSSMRPVEMYGLVVPPGDDPVFAFANDVFPASIRITMAAIDPTATPTANTGSDFKGASLKIIRIREDSDSDDDEEGDSDDDDDDAYDMSELLDGGSDDEDVNGGPSDPEKSPKARKEAALKQLVNGNGADSEDSMTSSQTPSSKQKGKARASTTDQMEDDEDDDEDDDDEDGEPADAEEFVLCTLDPTKNYQQPLDITINENEKILFMTSGTHAIYLTGNYVIPDVEEDGMLGSDDEDDDDEYDLSPGEDELELPGDMEESDALDDLEDPRVTEVDSEDDEMEVPKLLKTKIEVQKGKNKRPAEESDPDSSMTTGKDVVVNGEPAKLSKSQRKKQKKMENEAKSKAAADDVAKVATKSPAAAKDAVDASKPSPAKGDKKVSFAKTLVQGPSPTTNGKADATVNGTAASKDVASKDNAKAKTGPKMVSGVSVEDKKTGTGPAAKKGDKVSLRYIGKTDDKKVFDANKKGKPFSFQIGAGQVIKGWDIGVAGMTVGGERRIVIPAHLGYGSKGAGKDIPPNATLTFDLKLLSIG